MIELPLYLAFITATVILMLIPGPNMTLIVANSIANGTRYGLLTVAGTSSAILIQLALVTFGVNAIFTVLAYWFDWIRWVGVAYLIYLGIKQWRTIPASLGDVEPLPKRSVYTRGFAVSLTNPKVLLFYGAFFPQFVTVNEQMGAQLALLSATFLFLAIVIDSIWAMLAGRVRVLLARRQRLHNRLSGGLLIGAGIGLALARNR
jgi:homoserine/homoserine lactone efflux protein